MYFYAIVLIKDKVMDWLLSQEKNQYNYLGFDKK